MNIMICENLKKLRRQKGNKQEELAEHLGVSMQAVSKWERGECYPDITLVPAIALYYNVTADRLLGMDENVINAKIEEYLEKELEISMQSDLRSATEIRKKQIALWREAQKALPNNHIVLLHLLMGFALPYRNIINNNIISDNFEEIIKIGELLLTESTDNDIRVQVINILCNAYVNQKDFENAKKYANMAPSFHNSKEVLYGRCLSGEEHIKYRQKNIRDIINSIYYVLMRDMGLCGMSNEEIIKMQEFNLKLVHLLYSDGDFGSDEIWVCNVCDNLTRLNLNFGNTDEALYYLNEMADHLIKVYHYAKFHAIQGDFKHTSIMVNRLTSADNDWNITESVIREKTARDIKWIEDTQSFDNMRNDKRYTTAMEKMKALLQ